MAVEEATTAAVEATDSKAPDHPRPRHYHPSSQEAEGEAAAAAGAAEEAATATAVTREEAAPTAVRRLPRSPTRPLLSPPTHHTSISSTTGTPWSLSLTSGGAGTRRGHRRCGLESGWTTIVVRGRRPTCRTAETRCGHGASGSPESTVLLDGKRRRTLARSFCVRFVSMVVARLGAYALPLRLVADIS